MCKKYHQQFEFSYSKKLVSLKLTGKSFKMYIKTQQLQIIICKDLTMQLLLFNEGRFHLQGIYQPIQDLNAIHIYITNNTCEKKEFYFLFTVVNLHVIVSCIYFLFLSALHDTTKQLGHRTFSFIIESFTLKTSIVDSSSILYKNIQNYFYLQVNGN